MLNAFLIGLIAGIGILDERVLGSTLFGRPLFLSIFVGLVLGDLKQGIIIGAQLELVWMGIAVLELLPHLIMLREELLAQH